ncbi:uncharacterized protein C12orf40 homolog [Sarcophilus harrisii]|uniref:uncharacterized protein C12orf40 homolog n=1 Tax=Sarcophilus harrisii TaxID=9305 RepID=UPI0013020595|nr:uncharacterized protein C12orf40 homolog [Sarcophilus harrisii]
MNWVGGFRTRVLFKQEKRKQKEYFEKRKLKSMKFVEVLSPSKNSSVSLDLLDLYMVNQISMKKEETATVRKPTFVNVNRNTKICIGRKNLEFSMPSHYKVSNPCLNIENSYHAAQEKSDQKEKNEKEKKSNTSKEILDKKNQWRIKQFSKSGQLRPIERHAGKKGVKSIADVVYESQQQAGSQQGSSEALKPGTG